MGSALDMIRFNNLDSVVLSDYNKIQGCYDLLE